MSIRNRLQSLGDNLGIGSSTELEQLRDEILQGDDPRAVVENFVSQTDHDHIDHISDVAAALHEKGREELKKDEQEEQKVEKKLKEINSRFGRLTGEEAEDGNPDLGEYETVIQEIERDIEKARERQMEEIEMAEDARKYFEAVLVLASLKGSQVGRKKIEEELEEARNFEQRIKGLDSDIQEYERLLEDSRQKIEAARRAGNSGDADRAIEQQEEKIMELAEMLDSELGGR